MVICLRCKNSFYFSPLRRQYLHIKLTVPLYTCKREKGVSVLLYITGSNQFYREARLGNTSIYAVYMQIRRAPFPNSAVINKTYMASTNQKSCADLGFFPRGGSEGCTCFIVLCEITNTEGSSWIEHKKNVAKEFFTPSPTTYFQNNVCQNWAPRFIDTGSIVHDRDVVLTYIVFIPYM